MSRHTAHTPPLCSSTISTDSVVVAAPQQVSSQLGGETVILQLEEGVYYGLDPVGTRIWTLLQEPHAVRDIRDRILEEYQVEPERCESDLITLLDQLAERCLLDVTVVVPP